MLAITSFSALIYTSKTHGVRGTNERERDCIFVHIAYIKEQVYDDDYFAASLVRGHPVMSVHLAPASKTAELYE